MRKKVLVLALALVMLLGVTAQAAPMRMPYTKPLLSFSGTTALCTATVRADNTGDSILVTAKLWHNGTCLKTWSKQGKGYVNLSGSVTVTRGQSYTLTVDATINGAAQARRMETQTCP